MMKQTCMHTARCSADASFAPVCQSACLNTVLDAACVVVSIFIIRLLGLVRIIPQTAKP